MQGVIHGFGLDASGQLVIGVDYYTDDIVLTAGAPPPNTAPFHHEEFHVATNITTAQIQAALQSKVQAMATQHASVAAQAAQVLNQVVQVAG